MSFSSPIDTQLPWSPQDVPPELQDFAQGVYNAIRNLQASFAAVSSSVVVDAGTLIGDGTVLAPLQVKQPFDHLMVEVFC